MYLIRKKIVRLSRFLLNASGFTIVYSDISLVIQVLAKCDLCYTQPCENGASCHSLANRSYECSCLPAYHGTNCQYKIDACYGNPCENLGTCKVVETGRFRCVGKWNHACCEGCGFFIYFYYFEFFKNLFLSYFHLFITFIIIFIPFGAIGFLKWKYNFVHYDFYYVRSMTWL